MNRFVLLALLFCVPVAADKVYHVQRWRPAERAEEAEAPMATIYWNSTTGDPSQAGSWVGGVPTATDRVVWDGRSQAGVLGGYTIAGAEFRTMRGYRGDVGVDGNPITFGTQAAELLVQGSGRVYSTPVGSIDNFELSIMVDSPNLVDALTLSGQINSLFVKSGTARAVRGHRITDYCIVESSQGKPARLIMSSVSPASTLDMIIDGGEVDLYSDVVTTRLYMGSGSLHIFDGGAVSNVFMTGGTYINESTDTVPVLIAMGGVVDFSLDDRPKTVTLFVKGRDVQYLSHPSVTFTNPIADLEADVPVFTMP